MTQIYSRVYTLATKNKVIKPSQWKDDMYISLTWLRDGELLEAKEDLEVEWDPEGYDQYDPDQIIYPDDDWTNWESDDD